MRPNDDPGARERILRSGERLFAERGFHGTAVKEITEEAGVNKALLFYYFKSKEGLYRAVIQEARRGIMESMKGRIPGGEEVLPRLDAVIRFFLEIFGERRDLFRIIVREISGFGMVGRELIAEVFDSALKPLEEIMEQGIRTGIFREVNPKMAAISLMAILRVFTARQYVMGPEFTPEEIFRHAREVFLNGVRKR